MQNVEHAQFAHVGLFVLLQKPRSCSFRAVVRSLLSTAGIPQTAVSSRIRCLVRTIDPSVPQESRDPLRRTTLPARTSTAPRGPSPFKFKFIDFGDRLLQQQGILKQYTSHIESTIS